MSARHKTRNARYRQWVRWMMRYYANVGFPASPRTLVTPRGWLRFGHEKDRVKDREYLMRRGRERQP